jgi:hypothetical protein
MATSYYYLVSGLPDLVLEGNKNAPSYTEFCAGIFPFLDPADAVHLHALNLPFDNKNLVALLEKKDDPFDARGNFSQQELVDGIKMPDDLPPYMAAVVEAFKEQKPLYGDLSWEDQILCAFFDHARSSTNGFVRSWFEFEYDLRNVLAGINIRKRKETGGGEPGGALGTAAVLPVNDTAAAVERSSAPDFGLGSSHPWIEKVLSAAAGGLAEFEKNIDGLRWSMLDEFTTFSYFRLETILAFCVKLGLVERWQQLDPVKGEQLLKKLIEDMKSGVSIAGS